MQLSTANGFARATTLLKPHETAFCVTIYPLPLAGFFGTPSEESDLICNILRDIFGNPFRPVTVEPSWLTSTVVSRAQQMYDTRDFSAMPTLADALHDAGCSDAQVLDHCRGPGPHTRGYWCVDIALGKE